MSVVYMTFVEAYRPYWISVWRVILSTTVYMIGVGLINPLIGGNYLYVARKPPFPTLLDYLGPWPWYIIGLYGIGLVCIILVYLPFIIKDGLSTKPSAIFS